jgi:hypothetical protein
MTSSAAITSYDCCGLSVADSVIRIHIAWPGTIHVDAVARIQPPLAVSYVSIVLIEPVTVSVKSEW